MLRSQVPESIQLAVWVTIASLLCSYLLVPVKAWAVLEKKTLVGPDDPIPRKSYGRKSYSTWSLFLVCNPQWLLPIGRDRLRDLYDEFQAFGDAIGPDNLAVWFSRRKPNGTNPDPATDLDVERSSRFCRAFKLLPSRSPYVLVISEYPDLSDLPKHADREVIELGGSDPVAISTFLAQLSDQLLVRGLGSQPTDSEGYWATWFEAARSSLKEMGNRVKVKIVTSFLTVEISGDKP